jgi:hypothetical protein
LADPAAENEDRDVPVLLDQALISSLALPSRITISGSMPIDSRTLGRLGHDGLRLLAGFRAHDLLDAQPLLESRLGGSR